MKIQREIAVYNARRNEWLLAGQHGRYVVICGERVIGFFDDFSAAYDAGQREADGPHLVHPVLPAPDTALFTARAAVCSA